MSYKLIYRRVVKVFISLSILTAAFPVLTI